MAINGEQKMIGVTSFFVNQKSRWVDLGLSLDFREGTRLDESKYFLIDFANAFSCADSCNGGQNVRKLKPLFLRALHCLILLD
jgi:hypothetical protein